MVEALFLRKFSLPSQPTQSTSLCLPLLGGFFCSCASASLCEVGVTRETERTEALAPKPTPHALQICDHIEHQKGIQITPGVSYARSKQGLRKIRKKLRMQCLTIFLSCLLAEQVPATHDHKGLGSRR